jgi:hypothetical protein
MLPDHSAGSSSSAEPSSPLLLCRGCAGPCVALLFKGEKDLLIGSVANARLERCPCEHACGVGC